MSVSISSQASLRTYYSLTKPGIIFGNLITAAGAFALASTGSFDFSLLLATLIGLSFIIASACVFNNTIDREMDQKMERTKNRALAKGLISVQSAILFAFILAVSGVLLLATYAGLLPLCIALFGFFVYVLCYSLLKYRSVYATLVGSIAGAVPPVVGYCSATNSFDLGAGIIFMILVFWQMPHFYAISMYRLNDYAAASIPVLPIKSGVQTTKIHMLLYIVGLIIVSAMLTIFGYTGYLYLTASTLLGATWLWLSIKGFKAVNDTLWARKMFIFSLIFITLLSIMFAVDKVSTPVANSLVEQTIHRVGAS